MSRIIKKQLDELVGGDINSLGGDRNPVGDSEIETGPVQKPYNDDAYYDKGTSTVRERIIENKYSPLYANWFTGRRDR